MQSLQQLDLPEELTELFVVTSLDALAQLEEPMCFSNQIEA